MARAQVPKIRVSTGQYRAKNVWYLSLEKAEMGGSYGTRIGKAIDIA
jgi:hypothetical protein